MHDVGTSDMDYLRARMNAKFAEASDEESAEEPVPAHRCACTHCCVCLAHSSQQLLSLCGSILVLPVPC